VKRLLAVALAFIAANAPANEVEMLLMPRASAELIVQENLRQKETLETYEKLFQEQAKRIYQLQNGSNCV
jgi:hypothetical protein